MADNDEPGIRITESAGSTFVTEDGATDSYTIVLTREPDTPVIVRALAPLQTQEDEETLSKSMLVRSTAPGSVSGSDGSYVELTFTAANWDTEQTVIVEALDNADRTRTTMTTRSRAPATA